MVKLIVFATFVVAVALVIWGRPSQKAAIATVPHSPPDAIPVTTGIVVGSIPPYGENTRTYTSQISPDMVVVVEFNGGRGDNRRRVVRVKSLSGDFMSVGKDLPLELLRPDLSQPLAEAVQASEQLDLAAAPASR